MLLSEFTGGPTVSNTFFVGVTLGLVLNAAVLWAVVLKLFRGNEPAKKLLGFLVAILTIAVTFVTVSLIAAELEYLHYI